jgi:hypothetical protein
MQGAEKLEEETRERNNDSGGNYNSSFQDLFTFAEKSLMHS